MNSLGLTGAVTAMANAIAYNTKTAFFRISESQKFKTSKYSEVLSS